MERGDLTIMAAAGGRRGARRGAALRRRGAARGLRRLGAGARRYRLRIGEATDQLGITLGPAATGIVQSAVGNLPELFVCVFSLQAGLITVVQTSLVGSILSNALLVLGLAFIAGG